MRLVVRKAFLTAHLSSAVGWLGADAGFLALALVGLASRNLESVRASYLAMETIGWYVIVPFSLAALVTGLVLALGTPWGLFQHYWVIAKFVLTVGATFVLLVHTNAISAAARSVSGAPVASLADAQSRLIASHAGGHFGTVQMQLVVAAGAGLMVLFAILALGVFKPKGMTAYGRRKRHAH